MVYKHIAICYSYRVNSMLAGCVDVGLTRSARVVIALGLAAAAFAAFAALLYFGVIPFNNPSDILYPVRGVDVSEYQGEIDWQVLSAQGIDFAFIKATEGSRHVDPHFAYNWEQVNNTRLLAGAYHFFSFDSAGETQARNFLSAVPSAGGMLPPVVDIELYGAYKQSPKPADTVRAELDALIMALENAFGVKPIMYVTQKTYELYLSEGYDMYPLWVRSVYGEPFIQNWAFWQYSARERLDGYRGEERFIDMNAFNGDIAALKALCVTIDK